MMEVASIYVLAHPHDRACRIHGPNGELYLGYSRS